MPWKIRYLLTTVIAAKCFSLADVRGQVCWALCRQDGYEAGSYVAKGESCLCSHVVKFKEITDPRLIIRAQPPILPDVPDDSKIVIHFDN